MEWRRAETKEFRAACMMFRLGGARNKRNEQKNHGIHRLLSHALNAICLDFYVKPPNQIFRVENTVCNTSGFGAIGRGAKAEATRDHDRKRGRLRRR